MTARLIERWMPIAALSEESVRELRELVPHAEVVDVAGAGHMVVGDRNDAFNDAVIEFIGRAAPLP